ncbi:bifunctional cobalt-precorrin-7 (C(5))-methyltransferase/cobalt-precorrin-6B (C(15))-methyltransferase [Dysgonomonas sp. HGC4]|uniref:bifunctional cobalt-precorrin-7 (C(5))-methyltransferase/cobalt-precorrin-6B (C(15))-methyltransferase n=1 Tax=Dysgonomonas sp. HGC4 TaxID=1658009 RepID=UPI00067FBFF2|nr:bifunctional cobalt-precorrin-7 (C(5))-methyltransferase/cobalt-precorrin-6B (C(15))-methyltransferase [Dysgonomonas sp. HGC4]MBD8346621.1 bifunctional cobalt-precorrin-7 (C(5))-methyltransferase/cobalt-precorrin-6B (C(15))-methyltransferase [Dysgonomonas sp. HGC4]
MSENGRIRFYVIGIDDNQQQYFSPEIKEAISSHTVFSGGARHHEIAESFLPKEYTWIDIVVPLKNVFQQYQSHNEIVVFASGDPLFFGFANTIQREMPEAEIIVYPSFNSLQMLAHRLVLPYQDMHIVSLTGRPWLKFDQALIEGQSKIGVLTDNKEHIPSAIAERMLEYGYDNYIMHIGELLGNKEKEKVSTLELKEVIGKTFQFPNNLILTKTESRNRPFGIPESDFHLLNGRAKMITKMPVRLLLLSMLDLRDKSVFWDVGFCTGSVSVEAKMQFPHLEIFAFEQREEGKELIRNNARRFGTPGITSFIGDFTQTDTSRLPLPDAVFIGGHGGKMNEIVQKLTEVLNPNGVIVFNSVSDESRNLFLEAIENNGLKLEQSITIKVDDFNAIDVMKAIKSLN